MSMILGWLSAVQGLGTSRSECVVRGASGSLWNML